MRIRNFAIRCLALLSFSAVFLSGCSTDLDPNAEYKETMVIYAVLNPTDSVHYAKVNKAFLNTNSNALEIAANHPDSITYNADDLEVKLERLKSDSTVLNTYIMERFISTNKAGGTFAGPDQVLYRTKPNQPGTLDENSIYRIVATNKRSGVTASGATAMVKRSDNTINRFSVFQVSDRRVGVNAPLDLADTVDFNPHKINRVIFRAAENAFIYTIKVTFNYTESDGTTKQQKQLSYYIRQNILDDSKEIDIEVEKNQFFQNLMTMIDTSNDKPTTTRKPGAIFVTITGGSKSLETNYRVNNSFSIFAQVKPEWDNIKNGTGLVGSRNHRTVTAKLTQEAYLELANNSDYNKLKF